jgi:hypothetical protein
MEYWVVIFTVLVPVFSLIGTLLIIYSDRHHVPTDPNLPFARMTHFLNNRNGGADISNIMTHDRLYIPHNNKMKRLFWLGIICLILSFLSSCALVVITLVYPIH